MLTKSFVNNEISSERKIHGATVSHD